MLVKLAAIFFSMILVNNYVPVSYTHLDVYKRQDYRIVHSADAKYVGVVMKQISNGKYITVVVTYLSLIHISDHQSEQCFHVLQPFQGKA